MYERTIKAAIGLLFMVISTTGFAACNMGEDAKNVTQIEFGRVKLYGFPAGSLRISGQHALPNFDSWPFSLKVANNQIGLSVTTAGSVLSSPLRFNGTMKITRPISGYIIERITADGCVRELRVEDNVLVGNTIQMNSGTVGNSFGGKISLAKLLFKIDHQENLSDRRGQTRGVLVLRGQNLKVLGAQIRLPANDKLPTTANFNATPGKDVTFELPVGTLAARIRSGSFTTDPISSEVGTFPANWEKVFFWGETAQVAKIEDLKQASTPGGGTQISLRIAGTVPRSAQQAEADPTAVKVISCFKNGSAGQKQISIEQMHDCAGVWVTPRVLLSCALQARCAVLPDTLEGRSTFDAMLALEKLKLDSPLNLPSDPLHLPPMPTKDDITRCKGQSVSEDAFVACIKPTIGTKFKNVRVCFEGVTEGERLACLAKESGDSRFTTTLVGCFAGGQPSVDKLFACIAPKEMLSKADDVRECVNKATTPELRRACVTAGLGEKEKGVVDCVSTRTGSDTLACLDPLSPEVAKVRTVVGCLTTGAATTQTLECLAPQVGGDSAKIAACLTNPDRKAAAICLIGDKPEVKDALRAYNCVSGGRDASSIIANCTDGIIKDQKTRETLACVSRAGGDRAQLAGCAAGAVLPPDAARLVGCATTSQGPTSFALCAAGPAMNEEWRIAAECAVETGGNPIGFAGCTAGQLTARELTKCFTGEFGKDCFGPNNTIVKYFTNEFNDLLHGPGENNEIVKAVKALGDLTGGPNSVVNNPKQLLGGPNSLFNNPSQIWGGPNSVFNNPGQIWGGDHSVFHDPGQVFDPGRWRF